MLTSRFHFLLLVLVLAPVTGLNYCTDVRRSCPNKVTNVVCLRKNMCRPIANCAALVIPLDVKKHIVDSANKLRHKFAAGQGPETGVYVANMMTLSWHNELAYIARCVANTCQNRSYNRSCVISQAFSHGHIVETWQLRGLFEDPRDFFKQAFDNWRAAGNDMKSRGPWTDTQKKFGGIVMAKSTGVGCGWSKVRRPIEQSGSNRVVYYAACVFAINPDTRTSYIYEEPCTKCPRGRWCNKEFTALCGDIWYGDRSYYEGAEYYYDRGYVGVRIYTGLLLVVLLAGFQF